MIRTPMLASHLDRWLSFEPEAQRVKNADGNGRR